MKLTKEQRELIRKRISEGVKLRAIARELNVSLATIRYHSSEETKKLMNEKTKISFMKKSLEQRREIYKERKEYIREYYRKKYQGNEEFRNKEKARQRSYYKKGIGNESSNIH